MVYAGNFSMMLIVIKWIILMHRWKYCLGGVDFDAIAS